MKYIVHCAKKKLTAVFMILWLTVNSGAVLTSATAAVIDDPAQNVYDPQNEVGPNMAMLTRL